MPGDAALVIFSEIYIIEQKLRARLKEVLPKGVEVSHFSTLNHLAQTQGECSPAQLAKALNVTKGAMTNTLTRLEKNGYINIRKDWEDARKKYVSITQSGKLMRDMSAQAAAPIFEEIANEFDRETLRELSANLRKLRAGLS